MARLIPLMNNGMTKALLVLIVMTQTKAVWACEAHMPGMLFVGHKALLHTHSSPAKTASKSFPQSPEGYFERNQKARSSIDKGRCDLAIPLLEASLKEYADDGDLWRSLAICKTQAEKPLEAIEAYKKALELGTTPWDSESDTSFNPNDMVMNIARLYAQLREDEEALIWLKKSLDERYDERPDLYKDPAFKHLREREDFRKLIGYWQKKEFSREQAWLSDIEFLREQTSVLHFDPDHHIPAESLNKMLDGVVENITSLSDHEITAKLVAFVGALGAGHDIFWPVGGDLGALTPFALKFYYFNDGLFIIDAYDPTLIGARVESINETSVEEAYSLIARAFPGDNELAARWQSARHFAQAHTLKNLGIVKDADNIKLNIVDAFGKRYSVDPVRRPFTSFTPALTSPKSVANNTVEAPLYLSSMEDKAWTKYLPELNGLYIQIHTIRNFKEESFEEFSKKLGKHASDKKVKHLLLDLRHSPGGNGYLTPSLLRELVRFSANPDKGELFVLIGRNTFSASQNLITDLDWIVDPIFVGEPSGSKPNAFSESGHLRLPYSGLTLMLSSQFHQHSWPEDERIWIAPDVPVGLSSEQFFTGQDPAIDAIKAIIKSNI